CLQYNIDPFTF
nr:immunoglobulin light chain junction region [Macaca mulatta]MOX88954.1 immunoglobulin light chain junction region [Macaca mulatta]